MISDQTKEQASVDAARLKIANVGAAAAIQTLKGTIDMWSADIARSVDDHDFANAALMGAGALAGASSILALISEHMSANEKTANDIRSIAEGTGGA